MKTHHIALIVFSLLTGCGGSSEEKAELKRFDVSGTILVGQNLSIDTDINDPSSEFIRNNSFNTGEKQLIDNAVILAGFVTDRDTQQASSNFETSDDKRDIFYTFLQDGQRVQIEDVSLASNNTTESTIQLCLHDDSTNPNLIDERYCNNNVEDLKSKTALSSDFHHITVRSKSVNNKYVLSIVPPTITPAQDTSTTTESRSQQQSRPSTLVDNPQWESIRNEHVIIQFYESVSKDGTEYIKNRPYLIPVYQFEDFINLNMQWSVSTDQQNESENLLVRICDILEKHKNIQFASVNHLHYPSSIPNDPLFRSQEGLGVINLERAWEIETGVHQDENLKTTVAVIDSGIYSEHEDLKNKLINGFDFISSDDNAVDNDPGIDINPEDNGIVATGEIKYHGTHIAGIIAAETDNGTGISGVSWGTKIMPLRVIGQQGAFSYDLMQAVRYAAGLPNDSDREEFSSHVFEGPVDIINLSLGSQKFSRQELDTFQQVADEGILLVAAAGNSSENTVDFPAAYAPVLAVSAIKNDSLFSSYSNHGTEVDIAAPGGTLRGSKEGGILSSYTDGDTSDYEYLQGTSMATAHVSGLLALMKTYAKSNNDNLDITKFRNMLERGQITHDAGVTGKDDKYGYGILDAYKSLSNLATNNAQQSNDFPILQADKDHLIFDISINSLVNVNLDLINDFQDDYDITYNLFPTYLHDYLTLDIPENCTANIEKSSNCTISVNFSNSDNNLPKFNHYSLLQIHATPGIPIEIPITLKNNKSIDNRIKTAIYGHIIDPSNNKLIAETVINPGSSNFNFKSIPQGTYEIRFSSDIDFDSDFCSLGELCSRPFLTDSNIKITVDSDISDMQVPMSFVTNL